MAIYDETIFNIAYVLVLYVSIAGLYKDNPLYSIIEGCAIGTVCAQILVMGLKSLQTTIFTPLLNGEMVALGGLLLGLAYLTVFSKNTINIYRVVIGVTFGAGLGMGFPAILTVIWAAIVTYSNWTDYMAVLGGLTMVLSLTYAIFWKRADAVMGSRFRTLGLAAIFVYFGVGLGGDTVRAWSVLVGETINVVSMDFGIPIMLLVFAGILVDVFVGWNRILGLKKTSTSVT